MLNNALMFNVMILMCYVNILMYCIICCCIQHDIHGIYQSCCPGPCPQGVLKDKFKVLVLVLGAQFLVLVLVLDT